MTATSKQHVLPTTAGDLALEEYSLALNGHEWKVLHTYTVLSLEEEQQFLLGDHRPKVPYGLVLWPAGIALTHDVASRSMKGQRVLELGAGIGLPGIVAATFGADVVQTDRQDVALHLSKLNADRNGVKSIEHRVADWTVWEDQEQYDWILGSDVMYATFMHAHLLQIFETNLKPGGKILLSDPFRKESLPLLEAMEADGWKISMSKWSVGVKSPMRPVGVYELTRG